MYGRCVTSWKGYQVLFGRIHRRYMGTELPAWARKKLLNEGIKNIITANEQTNAKIVSLQSSDPEYVSCAKRLSKLESILQVNTDYTNVLTQLRDIDDLLASETDPDFTELAKSEKVQLEKSKIELEDCLIERLLKSDGRNDKNCIIEVRAGTGGEEAGVFAAELFKMYQGFASLKGWRSEVLTERESTKGLREGILSINGDSTDEGPYGVMRFENGVHRVQRVPSTEQAGRVHTSTASVYVTPEVEEAEFVFNTSDLKIDVYRSTGAGGQHVNTTESAVRITHIPTNLSVAIQDERSQHQNKAKAMQILRNRVAMHVEQERIEADRKLRGIQMPTGDRSERVRTYNFARDQITDHRIATSVHGMAAYLQGTLEMESTFNVRLHAQEVVERLEDENEAVQ